MRKQIEVLDRLIKQHQTATAELQSLADMERQLKDERNKLIASGEVNNKDTVARAGSILTQIQMIPYRVEAVEAEITKLKEALLRPTDDLRAVLEEAAAEKTKEAVRSVLKVIAPIAGASGADALVNKFFWGTTYGEALFPFQRGNLLSGDSDPRAAAQGMVDKARAFLNLKF